MGQYQKVWRAIGFISLVACGALGWVGVDALRAGNAFTLTIYLLGFLISLGTALVCAVLDLRYIRAEYAIGKRQLYEDTLGDAEFRRALIEAQRQYRAEQQGRDGAEPHAGNRPPGSE